MVDGKGSEVDNDSLLLVEQSRIILSFISSKFCYLFTKVFKILNLFINEVIIFYSLIMYKKT